MNPKNETPSIDSAIEIREIASLVYQSQFEPALGLIIQLLDKAEIKGGIQQSQNTGLEAENKSLKEYTQLASALTALFAHPSLQLSPRGFDRLVLYKTHLLGIFQLSGFRETDYLLSLIGSKGDSTESQTNFVFKGEQQVMKFLVLYSLYSETEIDFSIFLKNVPALAMPTYLTLCAEQCILLPVAEQRRDRLLELGSLLENIPLKDIYLGRLSHVWMNCSYADSKNKHDIKAHLNVVLQKWMANKGIKTPSLPVHRAKKARPVILIPSERFTSNHAMFRCYAPPIQQLRDKFHLVLMANPKEIDDNSKTYFDQVIEVDFKTSEVKKLVGKVIKLKPDVIYYPSLGMDTWTLLLANLRLAPIQMMSGGHPATSNSPFIDYFLLSEIGYSYEQHCFSETVVLMDTASSIQMIAPASASESIAPQVRKNPSSVRLAITSTALKLNAAFMAVCQRISQQSQKPVEFHFFPSEHGMHHQKIKQRIHEWIPEAKVYPSTDYNTYIANLNECDIHLSPFPFGGTNSNVDSMQQGIPLVALEGHEPHARMDSIFFLLSHLPNWLLTHSQEDYVQAALRLIHHDEERVAISEALLSQDFERIFRDHEFRYHDKVFGKTVEWLYHHHEVIQKDGRKLWTVQAQNEL